MVKLPVHVSHFLKVPGFLVKRLKQFEHLCHHLIPLSLLQVGDTAFKNCDKTSLFVEGRGGRREEGGREERREEGGGGGRRMEGGGRREGRRGREAERELQSPHSSLPTTCTYLSEGEIISHGRFSVILDTSLLSFNVW